MQTMPQVDAAEWKKLPSGLEVWDATEGTGDEVKPGGTVTVHYTGWLKSGQKFDSSVDRGQPLEFPIGRGHVIRGWDEGVGSMKVGGKRKLIIPAALGYGDRGAGGVIPPKDYAELAASGVAAVFGPGTPVPKAAREVLAAIRAKRA